MFALTDVNKDGHVDLAEFVVMQVRIRPPLDEPNEMRLMIRR